MSINTNAGPVVAAGRTYNKNVEKALQSIDEANKAVSEALATKKTHNIGSSVFNSKEPLVVDACTDAVKALKAQLSGRISAAVQQ